MKLMVHDRHTQDEPNAAPLPFAGSWPMIYIQALFFAARQMDKHQIENIVEEAREQVEKGSTCIERQRELLARCETEGLDLATARQFLTILMEAQKLHIADCECWERKLDNEQKTQRRSF